MQRRRTGRALGVDTGLALLALLALILAATGCTMTQTPFERAAGDAGSAFAASATTLAYAHDGKLTKAYARASFVIYRAQLKGLDRSLPALDGAPDPSTVRHLIELAQAAHPAVDDPCLDDGCDWRAQVEALQRASDAFLQAGGG